MILYKIIRPIFKVIMKLIYKIEIVGTENILNDEPLILVGNHTSKTDILLLGISTKRTIHFLAKSELHKGLKKYLFRNLGTIPVNRNNKDKKARETAQAYLEEGKVIAIFPEGTINKTDKLILPFKFGAVSLSQKTNAKILPFIIINNKKYNKSFKIEFLKPYNLTSNDLEKENKILMNKISNKLKENKRRKNEK